MSGGEGEGRGAEGAVLVTWVGEAEGARELAAALACAGSGPERAALFVELTDGSRPPRPALVATATARDLESRLAAHLPQVAAAARGRICHLAAPATVEGLEAARAAQPLARDAICVVGLPPALARDALDLDGPPARSALVRADLSDDRALAALAVRDLLVRGLRVAVAKRPLSWSTGRLAMFGALAPDASNGLPRRALERCL